MQGGCGVGTSKADGNSVDHGGADDDGEGFAREINVDGDGAKCGSGIGNDCIDAGVRP